MNPPRSPEPGAPRAGSPSGGEPQLHGVLVTFRRPGWLTITLDRLAEQVRPLDRLVVVDNGPLPESEAQVKRHEAGGRLVEYLPMAENLGFTGGVEFGMQHVLRTADDGDWIILLDDDDPPALPTDIRDMHRFAEQMLQHDPKTACVGIAGGRFDFRRGRIRRVPDTELNGPVPVDYLVSGRLPFYSVAAVRAVGPFHGPLFFGLSEIEYGLRLRRAGFSLYGNGRLWWATRAKSGRLNVTPTPSRRLSELRWRRYYSLRNTVYVLRRYGHPVTALRVSLIHGLLKPLANMFVAPRAALGHLCLNWRAVRDGWAGRLGCTVEPDSRSKHGSVSV